MKITLLVFAFMIAGYNVIPSPMQSKCEETYSHDVCFQLLNR
jgi:hypothetical protein